ncbi:PREDICTED: craniofacial development protein 1-like [Elephantulus edwardii]|uniref:craniofacial development protein 1-like n=1 Tax=Elephantulus edwardii TaxID=28737 RepID=UPI0003F0A38F|nr:PREDICTED: craniofacial development protein 1-like [Elephantulus edwardii]
MELFDSEDFLTSEEDEGLHAIEGGKYSEDDASELVKESEVDGEEQTQKTQEEKKKAQSFPARKRKLGGLSLEGEDVDAGAESGGTNSEEEDGSAEQEKDSKSEDARKKKGELWASFLNDVRPKSKVSAASTRVKREEEAAETSSSKLVKLEDLTRPPEAEKVRITKVFNFAGEEARLSLRAYHIPHKPIWEGGNISFGSRMLLASEAHYDKPLSEAGL